MYIMSSNLNAGCKDFAVLRHSAADSLRNVDKISCNVVRTSLRQSVLEPDGTESLHTLLNM